MTEKRSFLYRNKFAILSIAAVCLMMYNFHIYTSRPVNSTSNLSKLALQGETLWRENNCTSCHQLYGLGGYLGPDLTNVISAKGKGENYVKSFLNSGVRSMPKFQFTEIEKNALVAYLTSIDETGIYPNKDAKVFWNGWVALSDKDSTDER